MQTAKAQLAILGLRTARGQEIPIKSPKFSFFASGETA